MKIISLITLLLVFGCNSKGGGGGSSEPASNQIVTPSENNPPVINNEVPVKFTDISSGEFMVCGTSTSNKIYCWGANTMDSLGRVGFEQNGSSTPEIISSLKDKSVSPASLSLGGYGHNCFLDNQKPYCWGSMAKGYSGSITYNSTEPQEILLANNSALDQVTSISSGDDVCAISNDKKLYCWQKGQFFNSELKYPAKLVTIGTTPLSNVKQVSSAGSTKCAVTFSGDAYCWGYGTYPLGTGQRNSAPLKVLNPQGSSPLTNVASISTNGTGTTCAVMNDGSLYCWGSNYGGQIGNSTNQNTDFPSRVVGENNSGFLSNVKQVSAGSASASSCAVTNDGKAYCWGNNIAWSIGNGTQLNSYSPKRVKTSENSYLENVQKIVVGSQHSCALDSQGDIYCWGMNSSGQLGQSSITYTPISYATKIKAY